jgi:hypothetical protein
MADTKASLEVAAHAVRWTSNILTEVLGNYGRIVSRHQRDCLRAAIRALAEYDDLSGDARKAMEREVK